VWEELAYDERYEQLCDDETRRLVPVVALIGYDVEIPFMLWRSYVVLPNG
jgi:hypothetical protein